MSDERMAAVLLLFLGIAFLALAWRLMRGRAEGNQAGSTAALVLAIGIVGVATLLASGGDEPPQVRLLPFENLIDAIVRDGRLRGALTEMIANVLLFVPLGMALCWRFPALGVLRIALVTLGISLVVEVTQAVAQTGRWASTTDLIMNTLGGVIGALAATGIAPTASAEE